MPGQRRNRPPGAAVRRSPQLRSAPALPDQPPAVGGRVADLAPSAPLTRLRGSAPCPEPASEDCPPPTADMIRVDGERQQDGRPDGAAAQSLISQMTVPAESEPPTSACRSLTVPER